MPPRRNQNTSITKEALRKQLQFNYQKQVNVANVGNLADFTVNVVQLHYPLKPHKAEKKTVLAIIKIILDKSKI